MTRAEAIVEEARSWVGTKWIHQASLKGVGADCIGFIRGVGRGVGLIDPFETGEAARFANYGRNPSPTLLREACATFLDGIDKDEAGVGDILVFRIRRDPMHFAIRTERKGVPYMVHAYVQAQKVCEHRMDQFYWLPHIVGAYRYRLT